MLLNAGDAGAVKQRIAVLARRKAQVLAEDVRDRRAPIIITASDHFVWRFLFVDLAAGAWRGCQNLNSQRFRSSELVRFHGLTCHKFHYIAPGRLHLRAARRRGSKEGSVSTKMQYSEPF